MKNCATIMSDISFINESAGSDIASFIINSFKNNLI